jgi:hypothetical protein
MASDDDGRIAQRHGGIAGRNGNTGGERSDGRLSDGRLSDRRLSDGRLNGWAGRLRRRRDNNIDGGAQGRLRTNPSAGRLSGDDRDSRLRSRLKGDDREHGSGGRRNRNRVNSRLTGDGDGAVVRALGDLGRALNDGADLSSNHGAGGPGVLRLVSLRARVNPVPVPIADVVAVVDDDAVGRVPGVNALIAGLRLGAEEVEINLDSQREVDLQVEKGVGGGGHEGQGNSGSLHGWKERLKAKIYL